MKKNNLYKGTLETFIFQLLQQNDRMYGYEISKKIKDCTEGNLIIKESQLYPALHKMESDGLLTVDTEIVESRVRKYYSLTKKGKKEALFQFNEVNQFIAVLQNIIKPVYQPA